MRCISIHGISVAHCDFRTLVIHRSCEMNCTGTWKSDSVITIRILVICKIYDRDSDAIFTARLLDVALSKWYTRRNQRATKHGRTRSVYAIFYCLLWSVFTGTKQTEQFWKQFYIRRLKTRRNKEGIVLTNARRVIPWIRSFPCPMDKLNFPESRSNNLIDT